MTSDEDSGGDSSGEEMEMRKLMQAQNRKKKKSGGFQAMGLSHAVFKAITRKGYKLPTPIQRKTIPVIMEGQDVVAMARTGSGKTAAFLVPMLERLRAHSSKGARALILSPTRELALQTLKFTKELGKFTDLRAAVVLGGDRIEDQFSALHQNPDIIIATPGRLLHVLVEMNKSLRDVIYVVFDEADRLFEMGFAEQLKEILHRVPEIRQTLLFSATLPQTLVSFAQAGLSDPTLIRLDVDTKLSAQLKMSFLSCLAEDKEAILLHLLRDVIKDDQLTVVFAATKHHVEYLYALLTTCGISCTYIYSSLDQTARKIHVAKFQQKKVKVMLVTDLAARGIDIPQLDAVINYNFPAKAKLFVHRVGRVARAGRTGTAYSLVASDELAHLVDLHVFLGRPLKTVAQNGLVQDEDGCFGAVPRSVVNEQWDVLTANTQSLDLKNQKRVCHNAYKQYLKSRTPAASESIKRAKLLEKELGMLGYHPLFKKIDDTAELQQAISCLRNYKSKATIFEINATAKKSSHAVMRAKRSLHDRIIKRVKDSQPQSATSTSPCTHPASSTMEWTADRGEERKKKKGNRGPSKDADNYIAYQPANVNTEAGYRVNNNAVLDLMADEGGQLRSQTKARQWDRKRKKFVESQEGKTKRVKTESGNWIPASYKSNLYHTWVRKEKVEEADSDDNTTSTSSGDGRAKWKRGVQVTGTRAKRWHTQGTQEAGGKGGQDKRKFKAGKREIRSKEKILKERRRKAKVQSFQKQRQTVRAKRQANKKPR